MVIGFTPSQTKLLIDEEIQTVELEIQSGKRKGI